MQMLKVVFATAALALGLCASGAAVAQDDVLAPARDGQLQCFSPNPENKTCESLAAYTFDAEGRISNPADAVILESPVVIMRAVTAVTLRDGAVCGLLSAEDISRATFNVAGVEANAQQTQAMRQSLTQQLGPMLNTEVCTRFVAREGGGLTAEPTFQGTPRPELNQHVIWVRPEEGYRVAP